MQAVALINRLCPTVHFKTTIRFIIHVQQSFNFLSAANVDEDTLFEFSRKDLKDLFDGVEHFMLRRRVWNILEKLVRSVNVFKFKRSLTNFVWAAWYIE